MRTLAAALAIIALLGATATTPVGASENVAAVTSAAGSLPSEADDAGIVIVMDLSDSMNEDDGTGTVKLAGAKASMDILVRDHSGGQKFSIWGYPSADDDCSAGQFVVEPSELQDLNYFIAKIDALTANGNTPTGPALQAVADSLTGRGYDKGTIVLVSDGESNCGLPPCDVAAGIVKSGFDVTVDTIGFRQSAGGKEELQCIANATGGTYAEADDAAALDKYLQGLARPTVDIDVSYPETARAGESQRITVTLTNRSAVSADNLHLSLVFDQSGPDALGPAVVPPIKSLGNLPAGNHLVTDWTVDTGSRARLGTATFQIALSGQNLARVVKGGKFTTTAVDYTSADLSGILAEVRDGKFPLAILGDSYSAGEGASPYLTDIPAVSDSCHRSESTYVMPLFAKAKTRPYLLACSGAVVQDLYTGQHSDHVRATSPQLAQLASVPVAPGAILMTLGGNDIGFADIIAKCFSWSCGTAQDWREQKFADIANVRPILRNAYEKVWQELNSADFVSQRGGRFAPVIVLAYPQITHDTRYGACRPLFAPNEVELVNQLGALLNATIKQSVADVRAIGYEVYFVPDTQYAVLPNHTVCEAGDAAYINDIILGSIQESAHPKGSGYKLITSKVIAWLNAAQAVPPDPDVTDDVPSVSTTPSLGLRLKDEFFKARVQFFADRREKGLDGTLAPGGALDVNGSGYEPGSPVTLTIHSEPMTIASLTADEDGDISGTVTIPLIVSLGQHELVATGLGSDHRLRRDALPAEVVNVPPDGILALAFLAIIAALVAAAIFVRRRLFREPVSVATKGEAPAA